MIITPTKIDDTHKMGSLVGVPREKIVSVLGEPLWGMSDDRKSECEWSAMVEIGDESYAIAIWDWHGSGREGEWSYYGPIDIINKVLSGNP